MEWFYLIEQNQYGPFTEDDLHSLARQGVITHDQLVWRNGLAGWISYGEAFQDSSKAAPPTKRNLQSQPRPIEGDGSLRDLFESSKAALTGAWNTTATAIFVSLLVSSLIGGIPLVGVFIALGPMTVGLARYALLRARDQDPEMVDLFVGLKNISLLLRSTGLSLIICVLCLLIISVPVAISAGVALAKNGGIPANFEADGQAFMSAFMGALLITLPLAALLSFYLWSRLSLGFFKMAADEETSAFAALKAGWRVSKGKSFKLILIYLRIWCIGFIGIFALYTIVWLFSLIGEAAAIIAVVLLFLGYFFGGLALRAWLLVTLACYFDYFSGDEADAD
ncbi:DUF4339 domain-containing protein [Cerasicoccus frondis]|uniref:DUF4339 domain-containing protein n=1 Tax=Cerasicoccus frondis TaxID=490090 RepID=UPI0028527A60|nr:DUF4339 domain-containing protein [Cerasicoccus frondis]